MTSRLMLSLQPLFLFLTFGYKLIKQTRMTPLDEMVFYRGRVPSYDPRKDEPKNWLERLLQENSSSVNPQLSAPRDVGAGEDKNPEAAHFASTCPTAGAPIEQLIPAIHTRSTSALGDRELAKGPTCWEKQLISIWKRS
ncbi:hypothetical protein TRAPUB_7284 [Trametes pubescens]|uniref:Uncharacterized protein n=1 Tax=Trametes pubescens TaxID=154538 RepID=A0A1M2V3I6_TRAPU|nr:hypothetical protein TRAPUB_7284 [Trametes pubescens]